MNGLLMPGINFREPCNTGRDAGNTYFRSGNTNSVQANRLRRVPPETKVPSAVHGNTPVRYGIPSGNAR
jgi:hypothetical protein